MVLSGYMYAEFLGVENFHPDNLGYGLVGKLEGRQRPVMAVDQGLDQAIKDFKGSKRIRTQLESKGFTTVSSLLYAIPEQLRNMVGERGAAKVNQSLTEFFEELKITPSLKLMRSIIAEEVNPLPASREADLDQVVSDVLDSLTERERGVIERRYGIFNWRVSTLDEVADVYEVTRERIRQIEAKALRKLRHLSRLRRMERFLSLPDNSVAYKIAGLDIVRADLEILEDVSLQALGLEEPFAMWPNIARLAETDADGFLTRFSAPQLEQLGASLRDVYEKAKSGEYQKRAEPTDDSTVSEKAEDKKEQMPAYQNRLLPDLDVPQEVLDLIGVKPLYEVNIPRRIYHVMMRYHIATVGDVLARTTDELLKIRRFRNRGLGELTYALEIYIREVMTKGQLGEKERYLLNKIRSLPEISAGKFQPTARDKFSVRDLGVDLTFLRRVLHLPDGECVPFVAVSIAGDERAKKQATEYLTKLLGMLTDIVKPDSARTPNNPDYLTFINPDLNRI